MVLEEITKEVTDAESNAENQKTSLSGATQRGPTPEQRSTRQGSKSGGDTTDGSALASLASTIPCRRRSRSSGDRFRRLSSEIAPKRLRNASLPVHDAVKENTPPTPPSQPRRGGIFDVLAAVQEEERQFPDGYTMEVCAAFDDARLRRIHGRYESEHRSIGGLDALRRSYCEDLRAALLKFLDAVVGYVLYVQSPGQMRLTPGAPLDRLIVLWIAPKYRGMGHEKRLLHWWLQHAVRSVKYFTVRAPTHEVEELLQSEGFKQPKTTHEEDHATYIATV